MERKVIGKQWLEFNKMLFHQSYTTMSLLQSQGERVALNYLNKLPWLPETGKKAASQYWLGCKKYLDDVKTIADHHFTQAGELLVGAEKKQ